MRILFITATRLGDAVISTALLRHLCAVYPDARFTIACGEVAAGVFTRVPGLERLVMVTKKRWDAHWLGLWAELVGTRFDLAIDLRGSALTFFLPVKKRAIMRGGRRPGLRLHHVAGVLDLEPSPLPMAFFNEADVAAARSFLPAGRALIGLGPTANWDGKIWPVENFAALYREIAREMPDAIPVVFGGPGAMERELARPLLEALPGAIDAVGQFDLPVVAASLARMRIFVGNDSGLMHLAASAGAPVLGLFGPTSAAEYAPSGVMARAVLADGEPGGAPMSALSVEKVLLAARDLLSRDAVAA